MYIFVLFCKHLIGDFINYKTLVEKQYLGLQSNVGEKKITTNESYRSKKTGKRILLNKIKFSLIKRNEC